MADPFAVLGLPPNTPLAEAEVVYRRLLFEWHPDRHATEGPEATARAEARTRELNEAIGQLRQGWSAPPPRSDFARRPPPAPGWAAEERERVHVPVPCPFCGAPVTSLDAFERHLAEVHPNSARPRQRTGRSRRRRRGPLRASTVALANLAVVLVVIAVVAAGGGHDATLNRLEGNTPAEMSALAAADPARCPDGRYPQDRGIVIGDACSDRGWPVGYLAIGMFPSFMYFIYRKTTS